MLVVCTVKRIVSFGKGDFFLYVPGIRWLFVVCDRKQMVVRGMCQQADVYGMYPLADGCSW